MARKGKANNQHRSLKNLCENPLKTVKSVSAEKPYFVESNGKKYKLVLSTMLPKDIVWTETQFDVAGIGGGSEQPNKMKTTFHPATIEKHLKNLKQSQAIILTNRTDNSFAIVHEAVELIDPHVTPAEEFTAAVESKETLAIETPKPTETIVETEQAPNDNAPISDTEAPAENNVLEEEANNEATIDLSKVQRNNGTPKDFVELNWTGFIHPGHKSNKPVSAYSLVTQHDSIAAVRRNGAAIPIGFMFPHHILNIEDVSTNGRWAISKTDKKLDAWRKNPLSPDIITIDHQRQAPMIFMNMAAALELRKSGLFDEAPEWVHDHLGNAHAKMEKLKAELNPTKTPTAPKKSAPKATVKPEQPKIPVQAVAEPETPVPPKEENTTAIAPAISESSSTVATIDNNIAIIRQTIQAAKDTQQLIELDNGVAIAANEQAIQAMEETIAMSRDMGAPTPEVETLEFVPTSMVRVMKTLNIAWSMANDSNSMVVLQPADGQRIVMTRNEDLISASKFTM
ncbi:MAG: hypothetical protein HRT94_08555 [Alphaproteobacteria bacterium]|nr:hypothetical protein [Alphaproteobacteria bacterium]